MKNKKLKEFIANLQAMALELDENIVSENQEEENLSISTSNENTSDGVKNDNVVTLSYLTSKYFKVITSNGIVLDDRFINADTSEDRFGIGGAQSYFDVEVNYSDFLSAKGFTPETVDSCLLDIIGTTKMYHGTYYIISKANNKKYGPFREYNNNYYVDLKKLYNETGSADFRFIVGGDWGGYESFKYGISEIQFTRGPVVSLQIIKSPDKLNYIETEYFDTTGLLVKATYFDGTSYKTNQVSVKPNYLTMKDKRVEIWIDLGIEYIDISVLGVERFEMVAPPKKLIYFEGEEFDKNGLTVLAAYSDGSIDYVSDYSISPLKNLTTESNEVTIYYKGKKITQRIIVLSNYNGEKPTVINSNSYYALVNSARSVKNFSLPNDLSITYNIINKSLAYILDDVSSINTFLGLNISHVYRPNRKNIGYGNGFALNICERLIEEGENIYYVDGLGDWYTVEDEIVKSMTYTTVAPAALEKISLYKHYRDEYTGSDRDRFLPVKWLISGSHIRGFNIFGYLVMISDYIGNFYEIKYNSSNKIEEINSNGFFDTLDTYKLEYNSRGCLSEIKMPCEVYDPIKFTYNASGNIATIKIKGVTLRFYYSNGLISRIQTSDKYIISVEVTKNAEIEIAVNSDITKIPDGTQSASLSKLSKWLIGFDDVTEIKDIDGNTEIFKVIGNGYVSEYYQQTNSVVSYAEKYVVKTSPNLKITVYKADREDLFKLPYASFSFKVNQLTENAVTTYNERNLITAESENNVKTGDNSYLSYNRVYEYSDDTFLNTKQDTQYTIKNIVTGVTEPQVEEKNVRHIVNISYDSCNKPIKKAGCFYDDVNDKGYDTEEYVYDKNGQVVKVISYNSLSPENAFVSEMNYNEYGRLESEKSDAVVPATSYIYADTQTEPYGIGYPKGYIRQHWYDERRRPTYADFINSTEMLDDRVNIYYNLDAETKISDGTNTIEYAYNKDRLLSEIRIDGNEYGKITYDIRDENGNLKAEISQTAENAKGEKYTVKADKKQTYVKTYYGETLETKTNYNKYGETTSYSDYLTNDEIKFVYNTVGAITGYKCFNAGEKKYAESIRYNIFGGVSEITQSGLVDMTYVYSYGGAMLSDLKSITINSDTVINPEYDSLKRYTGRQVKHNGNTILTEKIEYEYVPMSVTVDNESKGIKRASSLPMEFTYKLGDGEEKTISYKYSVTNIVDGKPQTTKKDGNIARIIVDGNEIRYTYDDAGRLIREDNQLLNYSYIYTYDKKGNITGKTRYFYNDITLPIATNTYKYVSGKLAQINDEAPIIYDASGNPIQYRGGRLMWKGRQLISYSNNRVIIEFGYDGLGRRVQKGDIKYYYDSSDRLIKSSDGMEYFYDHTGVAGFKYEEETYYYVKDAQSNIIAILDSSGNVVVEYRYDAWGNQDVIGSDTAIGNRNPFRYRSYFYDTETRLYFLKTRYYDPAIGRFISQDSIKYADPMTLNGLNLYAYCGNDPINYIDPTGQFVISTSLAVWLGVGSAAVLLASIELTLHPIQNAIEDIGDAVGDLINDISINISSSSGSNNISNISQTGNESNNSSNDLLNFSIIDYVWFGKAGREGRDSGFIGVSDDELIDRLNKAKRENDSAMIQRILREMKIRGMRNKRKKRGGPNMRGFIFLFLIGLGEYLNNYNENAI